MRFLIVQDYKEKRSKCTLTPLEGEKGLRFIRLKRPSGLRGNQLEEVSVGSGVLLHVDAPPLTRADWDLAMEGQIVVPDATWARVPHVIRCLQVRSGARLERRSLPEGVVTAYPRVSKLYKDPSAGLASVEAVFTVTVVLGQPRRELLKGYHWAEDFLRRNRLVFQQFGL